MIPPNNAVKKKVASTYTTFEVLVFGQRKFQFTHPVSRTPCGVRPFRGGDPPQGGCVSIHAPRVGCDSEGKDTHNINTKRDLFCECTFFMNAALT